MLGNFRRDTNNIFYSKIDIWLGLTIAIAEFIVIAACVTLCMDASESASAKAVPFALLFLCFEIALFLLIADAFIRCRYIFKESYLFIQAGIFVRKKLPYSNIESFCESNNMLSAPACSLDRIKIAYKNESTAKKSFILISPRNKATFTEKLRVILEKKVKILQ